DLILPEPDVDVEPRERSIDFDDAQLRTPFASSSGLPPLGRPRETPMTPHPALDGLPLMELETPEAPPPAATPRATTPVDESALPSGLDLIEDAADHDLSTPLFNDTIVSRPSTEIEIVSTPAVGHSSTVFAARSVDALQSAVEREPENWGLRRELAEAMLEAGQRADGIRQLETAMTGAERSGDLEFATTLAEEIARLEPEAIKHHQKRVEYAFRTNNRARLIEAYLALADALLRADQGDKARTVYQRVLDLAPDEVRARTALDALTVPTP